MPESELERLEYDQWLVGFIQCQTELFVTKLKEVAATAKDEDSQMQLDDFIGSINFAIEEHIDPIGFDDSLGAYLKERINRLKGT